MSKNILFFSNHCEYSKKIYSLLKGKQHDIMYVCVDDPNINLPTFVQAVPLIYISNQKRIIVDEAVEMWANSIGGTSNSYSTNQQQPVQQVQQQVQQPTMNFEEMKKPQGEMSDNFSGGFSFSSNFSTIDDTIGDVGDSCGYMDLNGPQENIYTPSEDSFGNKNNKPSLDEFTKMRNLDVKL